MRLLLASSSPRRRELLSLLVAEFTTESPDIDESVGAGETPVDYVARLATEKASACLRAETAVLGADTVVVIGSQILGKPDDVSGARQMLTALSGRTHQVHTAVAVSIEEGTRVLVSSTAVTFASLPEQTIENYLRGEVVADKAGAYAIQGYAGAFVTRLEGSYSGVVGLPLAETRTLLIEAGVTLRHG